jgi:hypothetical protein
MASIQSSITAHSARSCSGMSGRSRLAACLMLTNLVYNMLRFEQIKRLNLDATA